MTRPGNVSVPSNIIDRSSFAGPGIVWMANNLADGATWPKPTSDDPITVTVGNVIVGGHAAELHVHHDDLRPGRSPIRHTRR